MNAPQYVHVDDLSDVPYVWKFYYTHHSNMVAPQYVQVDVISDLPFVWTFYYTHHREMDAPQYVYAPQYVHNDVHSDV